MSGVGAAFTVCDVVENSGRHGIMEPKTRTKHSTRTYGGKHTVEIFSALIFEEMNSKKEKSWKSSKQLCNGEATITRKTQSHSSIEP